MMQRATGPEEKGGRPYSPKSDMILLRLSSGTRLSWISLVANHWNKRKTGNALR